MSAVFAHFVDGPADAPAVVLLHPIATHSAIWAAQLPAWSARFKVVRVDLPGHGASPPVPMSGLQDYADGVCAVLDALGIAQACVVGLSLGGMVAQALALSAPSRVNALVLAHTSARTEPAVAEIWSRRIALLEAEGLEAQVATTLDRWFTPDFAAQSPLTLQWVASLIRATSPAGYRSAAEAIRRLDYLAALPAIRVPTLVVAGAEDAAVPPSAAATLAARIAGARLEVLQAAAHIGNVQQPVRFTEVVGQFIASALSQEERP